MLVAATGASEGVPDGVAVGVAVGVVSVGVGTVEGDGVAVAQWHTYFEKSPRGAARRRHTMGVVKSRLRADSRCQELTCDFTSIRCLIRSTMYI